jgi:hypothetical protein
VRSWKVNDPIKTGTMAMLISSFWMHKKEKRKLTFKVDLSISRKVPTFVTFFTPTWGSVDHGILKEIIEEERETCKDIFSFYNESDLV